MRAWRAPEVAPQGARARTEERTASSAVAGKLTFALHQYALLAVFTAAAYGLGRPLTAWIPGGSGTSRLIAVPLRIAAGLGVLMVLLFLAGLLGWLNWPVVAVLFLVGLGIGLTPRMGGSRPRGPVRPALQTLAATLRRIPKAAWWWTAIAVAVSLPLLIAPLEPPTAWDELAYHLPYARLWASEGSLAVSAWLRYPLSAYNMDLLYAAALILGSDVLPHLLHGLTGALTAVLTYGVARRFMDWRVGLVAALLLLFVTRWGWSNAYVDLGVMLYWSSAFAAIALRHALGDARFSDLAAFFAGIAVGIKYQGLFYLPVFVVLALTVERRPAVALRASFIFLAVGGYWYLRNYLISGDPVHPIGGHIFGFWLWSPADLANQHGDLEQVRGWRDWLFLPALGAPLLWRSATPFQRGLLLCAGAALGLWLSVSGYWRYAVPIYPMLAVLSAWVVVELWSRSGLPLSLVPRLRRLHPRLPRVLAYLVSILVAVTAVRLGSAAWARVMPEGQARSDYLARQFGGYDLIRSLGGRPVETPYQLGFEGEIYYLGDSVRGDWFGPGRYADLLALAQNPCALARHIRGLGADGLLINLGREPFASQSWGPGMADYFELVGRSERALLYRLRPEPARGSVGPGVGGRGGTTGVCPDGGVPE